MDNIYKVVDNACTKVKNELACRRAADRIIQELSYLDITNLPCANFNKYLQLYVNEFAFRWNNREIEDMFGLVVRRGVLV